MRLQDFFIRYPKVAVAFSGGVDSAYLLYAAKKYAKSVRAYYVKSEFQPSFELDDARKIAEELKADMRVLYLSALSEICVADNPPDRCYYCKKNIFSLISQTAREDGYDILLDGTNASDEAADRPGMRALEEFKVLSPLRLCEMTKSTVRKLSKEAGLFTWDKPSYSCLATRISTGEPITADKLAVTEEAEDYLFSLGFTDFRIRMQNGHGRIQVPEQQLNKVLKYREKIAEELKKYYKTVSLDLEVRK